MRISKAQPVALPTTAFARGADLQFRLALPLQRPQRGGYGGVIVGYEGHVMLQSLSRDPLSEYTIMSSSSSYSALCAA
jgi:hypothetical protein